MTGPKDARVRGRPRRPELAVEKAKRVRKAQAKEQLLALLDIQAQLLDRALTTADLLRWKLINSGYPLDQIDRMPYINDPANGKRPPRPRVEFGIRMGEDTQPALLSVVPVAEMDERDYHLHLYYRHDREEMTQGIHDWLHLSGKQNHIHAIREAVNGDKTTSVRSTVRVR